MPKHSETSLTMYPQTSSYICYIILANEEEHACTSSDTLMPVCNYKHNKIPPSNYNKRADVSLWSKHIWWSVEKKCHVQSSLSSTSMWRLCRMTFLMWSRSTPHKCMFLLQIFKRRINYVMGQRGNPQLWHLLEHGILYHGNLVHGQTETNPWITWKLSCQCQ